MFNYSNQNRNINRTFNMEKTASVYDKQSLSNRIVEEKPLSFSTLSPHESKVIFDVMEKDACVLRESGFEKKAFQFSTPFDHFRTAKNVISHKLGLGDDVAHDLASGIVGKAQRLRDEVGGDIDPIISGIVDNIDVNEIEKRVGVMPMRTRSTQDTEERVKLRLMEEMQLSAFVADQVTRSVMQQSKNVSTRFRNSTSEQIADAIVDIIVNYQDTSIVYGLSSNSVLLKELEQILG